MDLPCLQIILQCAIQSTLVISTSLISNNCLSRSENPVLTQRSTNRQQNIVEKRRNCSWGAISPLFHNIFNLSLTSRVQLHIHLYVYLLNVVVRIIFFLSSANLICRGTDISKYFISLGFRDNESRLYIPSDTWANFVNPGAKAIKHFSCSAQLSSAQLSWAWHFLCQ